MFLIRTTNLKYYYKVMLYVNEESLNSHIINVNQPIECIESYELSQVSSKSL